MWSLCGNNAARGREAVLMMSKGQAYARDSLILDKREAEKAPGEKTATKRKENGS